MIRQYSRCLDAHRVQLVEDSMDLAWKGTLKYRNVVQLLDYLQQETEYLPWQAALSNFKLLNRMLRRTLAYGLFRVGNLNILIFNFNMHWIIFFNEKKSEDYLKYNVLGTTSTRKVPKCS